MGFWYLGSLITVFLIIFKVLLTFNVKDDIALFRKAFTTVLPTKSDSDVMFCLQSYWGLILDSSLVY